MMSAKVEAVVTKCYICDVACVALEKYRGISIARKFVLPMKSLLLKLLRIHVDSVDEEIFCPECSKKIEEYDHILQLTEQIETDILDLFRGKSGAADWENEVLAKDVTKISSLKRPRKPKQLKPSGSSDESTSQRVFVEYLDDYYTGVVKAEQSNINRCSDSVTNTETTDLEISIILDAIVRDKISSHEGNVSTEEERTGDEITLETSQETSFSSAEEAATSKSSAKCSRPTKIKQIPKSPSAVKSKPPVPEFTKSPRRSTRSRAKTPVAATTAVDAKSKQKTNDDESEADSTANDEDYDKDDGFSMNEENRFTCDKCGKEYKSKSAIKIHLNTHSRATLHRCHVCEKTFTQHGALSRHMPLHTGERPYQVCLATLL